jgi:hypothetical protein
MDSRLARIGTYLLGCASSGDFDPKALDADLAHVFILDIEPASAPRLRVRLTGTALDRAFGRPLTGRYLDEFIHGPRGDDVLRGFQHCARTGEALWMREVVEIADKPARFVEGALVHLAPRRIYGGLAFGEWAHQHATNFERRPLKAALAPGEGAQP